MSQLILAQQSTAPSAPSTGKVSVYVDSNGDLAWKDAAGNITTIAASGSYTLTLPASGTPALLATANVFTGLQTIPMVRSAAPVSLFDDTATSIAFTAATTGILIFTAGLSTVASGMFIFRVGSSLMCAVLAQAAGSVLATTTNVALTGTTGTDGKLTVSAHSDNKLYIENRTGSPFSAAWQVLGVT